MAVMIVYEKCKHGRLDPHPWYPHDYNREFDTSDDEKLLIGGRWDGGYWCPGGREIVFEKIVFDPPLDRWPLGLWLEVTDNDAS